MIKLITRALLSTCALLLAAACVAPPVLVTPSPVETPPPAAPPTETSLPAGPPAAVDPVSTLNTDVKPQAFTVRLTDGRGKQARVSTRPDEPTLRFPPGFVEPLDGSDGVFFTGIVPLTTLRLPLSAIAGVDLTNIREIALLFDQRPSGSLFVGDLEWVR